MSQAIMSHSHRHGSHALASSWRPALVLAVLTTLAASLGLALVTAKVDLAPERFGIERADAAVAPLVSYPTPELPREWSWQQPGVEYQHMYNRPPSARADWIREARRR